MNWDYNEDKSQIVLEKVPRARKKATGTRLGAILGLNEWSTPFQAWCEIVKIAQPPFEGNKYTEAGKIIEPKLIQFVRDKYFDLEPEKVQDPQQYFGNRWEEISKKYDFFYDTKITGGMWDSVHLDENNRIDLIVECKTSSRPQDWINGIPNHYAIQGLLYAYLTGAKEILFPVAFLKDDDYNHPENYVCNDENSKIFRLTTSDQIEGKTIEEHLLYLEEWYQTYVEGGISPKFDEVKDKEYLNIIRQSKPINDTSLDELIKKYDETQALIESIKFNNGLDELEQILKTLKENITETMKQNMSENETKITHCGYTLNKSVRRSVDNDRLKEDGLFDEYCKISYTYTLKKEKENK